MITAAQVVADDEAIALAQCQECGKVEKLEDVEQGRIYECGECGGRFTSLENESRRCEQCNKFAARVDSKAGSRVRRGEDVPICPDCGDQEMDAVDGYECRFCSEVVLGDAYAAHLTEQHESDLEAEEGEEA